MIDIVLRQNLSFCNVLFDSRSNRGCECVIPVCFAGFRKDPGSGGNIQRERFKGETST